MASEIESPSVASAGFTLSAGDLEFLAQCLSNTNGGKVIVDCAAVAKARGQSNPRSIANRLTTFRTKTGIPLLAGNTSGNIGDVKFGCSNSSNGGSTGDEVYGTASQIKKTPKRTAPAMAKTPRAKKSKVTTPIVAESGSEGKVEVSALQESALAVESEVEARG